MVYDSLSAKGFYIKGDSFLIQIIHQADRLVEDTAIRSNVFLATLLLGDDLCSSSQYFKSLFYFEKYQVMAEKVLWKDPIEDAFVNFRIGDNYTRIGDNTKALIYYERALKTYSKLGNKGYIVACKTNISNCLSDAKQYNLAIEVVRLPDSLTGVSLQRKSLNHAAAAAAYLGNGNLAMAEDLIQQALAMTQADNHLQRSAILQLAAEIFLKKQELPEAIQATRQAISHGWAHYDNLRLREMGKLFVLLGKCFDLSGNTDSAIFYYHKALYTVTDIDSSNIFSIPAKENLYAENTIFEALEVKAGWMVRHAEDSDRTKYLTCAVNCYDLCFEVERKLLLNFSYDDSKLRMLKESRQRSENAIAVCYQLYSVTKNPIWIEKAFWFAERNKSFILLESVKRNLAGALVQNDTLYQQVQKLQLQYSYTEKQLISSRNKADSSSVSEAEKQLHETDEKLQLAKTALFQSNSAYRQWIEKEDSISIQQAKSLLSSHQIALLEYFAGDSASYVFVITKEKAPRFIRIETSALKVVDSLLYYFTNKNAILSDISGYQNTAHAVFVHLVKPCIEDLPVTMLLVIPDGNICYLPFDALLTNPSTGSNLQSLPYCIKKFQTSYGYSIATLLKSPGLTANNTIVAFGPLFEQQQRGLSNLPFSSEELKAIEQAGNSKIFSGAQASLPNFRQSVQSAGIIHIASHANASTDSAIATIDFIDSSLYLPELYSMRINAQLIVLSACETGIGKLEQSEGSMSLARGFYYAGVPNIITSLWEVNDQSTATLFKKFYSVLDRNNYTASLQQAKLDYLAQEQGNQKYSPYYWASFINIGRESDNNSSIRWGLWGIVIGAGVSIFIFYRLTRKPKTNT